MVIVGNVTGEAGGIAQAGVLAVNDIVERLRALAAKEGIYPKEVREAAAEIERLRKENKEFKAALLMMAARVQDARERKDLGETLG